MTGGDSREKCEFPGGGPAAIISTLGILRPDPKTKEFYLDAYYPFTTIDEVKANTGWDLKISQHVKIVPEPTAKELEDLRVVDETGSLRKKG